MVHAIPEVTVVIPTRNRWDLLSRSGLPAALMQKDVDLEVIVVDDGSTDETPGRLAALEDPRVRVIRQDQGQGVASARNRGVAEARSEWVAFLDDDDLWSPDKLRRQLDLATEASAGFVYGPAVVVDDRRNVLKLLASPKPTELAGGLTRENILPAGQSNVMARTDVVRRLGGFDEHLSLVADWDMWIRLANAEQAVASPDVLVGYVLHAEAMHASLSESAGAQEFAYLTSKHHFDRAESRTAELLTARWVASVHRRAGRRPRAAREYLRSAVAHRSAGMLVRGIAILFGEWAMRLGPGYTAARGMSRPGWLSLYGDGDRARG
jgi:glycosyltransferase involved in cell wall biosynthesis